MPNLAMLKTSAKPAEPAENQSVARPSQGGPVTMPTLTATESAAYASHRAAAESSRKALVARIAAARAALSAVSK